MVYCDKVCHQRNSYACLFNFTGFAADMQLYLPKAPILFYFVSPFGDIALKKVQCNIVL